MKKKFDIKKCASFILQMILGAGVGVIFGIYLLEAPEKSSMIQELLYPFYLIGCIIISLIIQTIIHEVGHLFFGLLSGYKFSSFRIFSLMIIKDNGKIRFKKLSLVGTAGQCLMSPPEIKDGKIPVTLYNLGGSLMNIISCAILTPIYCLLKDVPYLSAGLMVLIMFGIIGAFTNAIPMNMGAVNNDGYNAISLRKNPDAMAAFYNQLKVNELSTKGIRLKHMDESYFTVPSDDAMKNCLVATQGVFACNRLVDMHQFDEADKLMEHILKIDTAIVGVHKNLLMCDRIYIALINHRVDNIERMLSKEQKSFMKSMKEYPTVIRTNFVLALLFENDTEKAEQYRKQFNKRAKSYPFENDIEAERELMDIAERVYNEYK